MLELELHLSKFVFKLTFQGFLLSFEFLYIFFFFFHTRATLQYFLHFRLFLLEVRLHFTELLSEVVVLFAELLHFLVQLACVLLHFVIVNGFDIFQLAVKLMLLFLMLDFQLFVGVLIEF